MYFYESMLLILRIPRRANNNKPLNYWKRLTIYITLIFMLFDISKKEYSEEWPYQGKGMQRNTFLDKGSFVSSCKCTHLRDEARLFFSLISLLEKIPFSFKGVFQKYREKQISLN